MPQGALPHSKGRPLILLRRMLVEAASRCDRLVGNSKSICKEGRMAVLQRRTHGFPTGTSKHLVNRRTTRGARIRGPQLRKILGRFVGIWRDRAANATGIHNRTKQ